MYYYAVIEDGTGVCYELAEVETEINNPYYIAIDSYDVSLKFRKKYVNGSWVDTTPAEAMQYNGLHIGLFGKWLDQITGDTDDLAEGITATTLVGAVNECFQSASDGKTAIANAITGVDESITIPTNPTFAQLAACIAQISTGMQVAIGSMNVYTIPESITGETPFQPKIVIVYNFGSGLSNFNMGLYVSPEVTGVSSQQISDSANGIGNKLSRRANAFTITENGFSMVNSGAAINLKWIALG